MLICGQASYPFDIPAVLSMFFVWIGLVSAMRSRRYERVQTEDRIDGGSSISAKCIRPIGLVLLACSFLILRFSVEKSDAYFSWAGLNGQNAGLAKYEQNYRVLMSDAEFMNSFIDQLLAEGRYQELIHTLTYNNH